jgi:hypothetical protein
MEPKGPARVERRLAATLAADAGHSRLTEVDEESTLGRFGKLRAGMIDPKITSHKSHIDPRGVRRRCAEVRNIASRDCRRSEALLCRTRGRCAEQKSDGLEVPSCYRWELSRRAGAAEIWAHRGNARINPSLPASFLPERRRSERF